MELNKDLFKKHDGILMVSVSFVILMSFIGLALLTHSISHIRIQRARFDKAKAVSQMTHDLLHYLHNQREMIFTINLNDYPVPEVDFFNRDFFPDFKKTPLLISNSFSHHTIENSLFKRIRISDAIKTTSETNNHQIRTIVFVDILSGKIPLNLFPLFLNKKIEDSEQQFLETKGISIKGTSHFIISDTAVEFHVSDFLIDSLKISGGILNWENLRQRFGLEIKDEPIEKGIYFIVEANILESIFIQEDLQRMIFSTENGQQIIRLYIAGELFEIGYLPGKEGFFCWNGQIKPDSLFNEKIIVNGNVWSLEQDGDPAFHQDSNITLLVSGKTIIRTSLKSEQLDINKIEIPKLTLICSNNKLFGSQNQSEVLVDTQKQTTLGLSLIINGAFSNQSPDLSISGNVFAKDLNNKGMINITHQMYKDSLSGYFHTKDHKCVSNFLVACIEELHDDQE